MTGAGTLAAVQTAVQAHWDVGGVSLEPLPGGMNSTTWTVTTTAAGLRGRWVAKLVDVDQREAFARGLHAARRVDGAGIPAGPAEPTRDCRASCDVDGGVLALLRWVDGRPLTGESDDDQTSMGATLGLAHLALLDGAATTTEELRDFPAWVDVDADHLDVEEWVRPAVRAALDRYAELVDPVAGTGAVLTWGLLHGDPASDAFLWSAERQRCGLIDWSSAMPGPLLYDLASAVMYVGGPARAEALLGAYSRTAALSATEITGGVETLLRVRGAVQADYFAQRLATDDRTGIDDPRENVTGLHEARDLLRRDA